jgi:hypothetical protein
MIELCDTPVECDLEINEAASGVVICNTGLLITGLEGTMGKVEDLDIMPKPFLLGPDEAELEEVGDGKVLVLDSKGIVKDVDVIEYVVVVTGDNALVVVVVAVLLVGLGVLTFLLLLPSGASAAASVFEAF